MDSELEDSNDLQMNSDLVSIVVIDAEEEYSTVRSPSASPIVTTPRSCRKRKRKSLSKQASPEKSATSNVSDIDDDDGTICPICLDSWEMSGTHRIVSLKCGHLFGLSCIQRWLNECRSNAKVCPSCKSKAANRDIRHIYAKRILVLDKSEEDRLKQALKEEKIKYDQLAMEKALMKVELKLQNELCNHLQRQLDCIKGLKNQQPSNMSAAGDYKSSQECNNERNRSFKLFMEKNLEISRDPGCRVMTYINQHRSLLISQKSCVTLFPGYGVRYVDTSDTFRTGAFVHVAEKQIRDLNIDLSENFFVAAYMDRTMKMFNVHTHSSVASFTPSDRQLWAVAFDRERSKFVYAGAQHGSTYVYDVRNSGAFVDEYKTEGDMSPVVNISSVPAGRVLPFGGILVCKLQSMWLFEYTATQSVTTTKLSIDGPFISMTYDYTTDYVLISTRPSTKNPTTRYIVAQLERVAPDAILLRIIQIFFGSKTQTIMSRCAQINVNDNVIVTAYLQDAQVLTTWNVSSKLKMQSMPMVPMVLDLCPIYSPTNMEAASLTSSENGSVYLGALTENRCRIYKIQMCD